MPVATLPRLFSSYLLPLLVGVASLMSSCQSSRPSFAFRPAPGEAARTEIVAPLAAAPDSAAVAVAPVAAKAAVPLVRRPQRKAQRPAPATRMISAARVLLTPQVGLSKNTSRRPLLHRSHGTAEAGLGTTVLGVLGLVILPIALIGLAISGGGLVWAIVAGAAALAVLVAYIDPFGR